MVLLVSPGCCTRRPLPQNFLSETIAYRTSKDSSFRNDPESPFRQDTSIQYHGLSWFPPDSNYCFLSKLNRYQNPEHVTIFGTKGEERPMIRYGYFLIDFGGRQYVLNVYKNPPNKKNDHSGIEEPLSIWFTDETTGRETYHVGRYVDVGEEEPNPNFVYTINFNDAYNPYCAYSSKYSCAIPRKEDHLPFAVYAGEKKYHE